jgi:hypothetical protein
VQASNAQPPKKPEAKPAVTVTNRPQAEVKPAVAAISRPKNVRTQLEEQIKAEKLKALTLKREGKLGEALEALRSSKRLEKKLASLG